MQKRGNYNYDYINTVYKTSCGYYDTYNFENLSDNDKTALIAHRRKTIPKTSNKYIYEFVMTPNDPFLNENKPLPPNVELKISFDRLPAEYAIYATGNDKTLKGTVLELKSVYAQVEYISSPALRTYFDMIHSEPINFEYDEISVLAKSLPINETTIRLENIKGGNTPDYLFIAITPTVGLNGNLEYSPMNFQNYGVKELNLTLNGNPCHSFPMLINNGYPIWPYIKFIDVLGRLHNTQAANQMDMESFSTNLIYAHKFEGEDTSQGWLGITISLKDAFDSPYTLIMWTVNNVRTTLDKFGHVDKYVL